MLAFTLAACSTTTPNPLASPIPSSQSQAPQGNIPQSSTQAPPINSPISTPNPAITPPLVLPPTRQTPPLPQPQNNNFQIAFSDYLPSWNETNLVPAITAFARNCPIWEARARNKYLLMGKPEFGDYSHWQAICEVLPPAPYNNDLARWFFESYFLPSNLLTADRLEGLLTGYYEPEINVRSRPDAEFSEPILAKPDGFGLWPPD